jgi:hypothetical protein
MSWNYEQNHFVISINIKSTLKRTYVLHHSNDLTEEGEKFNEK